MQLRSPSRSAAPRIEELIARRDLSAVFQPIIDFDDGAILGYEGLIRGPAGTPLETPFALFSQALAEGSAIELERAAARTCIEAFAKLEFDGKLFLNFSAGAIRQFAEERDDTFALLRNRGVDPAADRDRADRAKRDSRRRQLPAGDFDAAHGSAHSSHSTTTAPRTPA